MDTISYSQDTKFLEGSRRRYNRKWNPLVNKNFDDLISQFDHSTIVSASRRLYANHGVVKGVVNQKAMYSVGQAFLPLYQGTDKDWKIQATDWLLKFYAVADTKGLGLQTCIYLLSLSIDRDGDAWILLTETKAGYPQIQLIPSHQIGQRDDSKRVVSGKYKGLKICKGVITAKDGRPMAYRVLGETEEQDQDISSENLIRIFDPEYVDQDRGLPLFSHAVNAFKDMASSNEKELMAQLLLSTLTFVETNPSGESEDLPLGDVSTDGKPSCETFTDDGGIIKFFKSGDGSKLEPVNNNRPSAEYQNFHDRLERIALVGCNWPKALIDSASGASTADRISMRVGQRSVEDRQALLIPVVLRIINYAISKAIKLELIPFNPDFYKWTLSTPPAISIDTGRDMAALISAYQLGIINLTEIVTDNGGNLEDHLRTRYVEEALAEILRNETELEYKVKINPLNCRLNAPNQYQQTTPTV